MLKTNIEFRKGVLFIRLNGIIDSEKYLEELNNLIEEIGIKYVVLNIGSIKYFDVKSIKNIVNYNKKILKERKKLLICDNNTNREKLFNNIPNINCEIEAFSLI